MKIVIAEKPDQAAKLAAPFSFTKRLVILKLSQTRTFRKVRSLHGRSVIYVN